MWRWMAPEVQANASKHKAMSHERMLRAEEELEKESKALMRRAETAAATARQRQERAEESRARAAASREADAPAAEQDELNRKAHTAEAKTKAAREKAIEVAQDAGLGMPDLEPRSAEAMPRRELARRADGTPTRKTQHNFIDFDSHLMQSGGSYLQGYNCQLAVDSDHQVIVAVGVSNQPPDVVHLEPMLQRIATTAGARPEVMTMEGATGARTRPRPAPIRALTRISPPAAFRLVSHCRRNGAHCPKMPMPERAWPASSGANKDQ